MWRYSLRVGLLLGWKQIRYASVWTNVMIVFIMTLTFLNLVVVSGILVGLIEGALQANRDQYTGDVFISTPAGEEYIEESNVILETLENIPGVVDYSPRYTAGSTVEANYRTRRDPQQVRDTVGAQIAGIDPLREDRVTHLSDFVAEGSYLEPGDEGFVLMGKNLIDRYSADFGEGFGFSSLAEIYPGDKVRITANGRTKEFKVKGIIDSKVNETSLRIFMVDTEMRRFIGRSSLNINEVAVVSAPGTDPEKLRNDLTASGLEKWAVVRLSQEVTGQFLEDIKLTFSILGNIISSIGLLVASITIFIIVFINAITRRKFIGILKGIGIRPWAIEFSYVFQSIIYAVLGSVIAIVLIYWVLVPYFQAHPLNFPFSDGILVAPVNGTAIRVVILIAATIIAGYIPARLIIKKNTLDSILGR